MTVALSKISAFFMASILALSCVAQTSAQDNTPEYVKLKVIDPFLELHTGPGRGYPIFHVVEQDEMVSVLRRRTNWYYVQDNRQRQGWVKQEGLARTLAPTGLPAALPETQHETASFTAGFRLLSWAGLEAEYGQIFGKFIDGEMYSGSIIVEPIKSWKFTPFISKGYGRQNWQVKEKQQVGTSQELDTEFEFTGLGINYYIGYSFVVRAEFRSIYLNADNENGNQTAWRLGFSSFF